jgi:hypothetical protein
MVKGTLLSYLLFCVSIVSFGQKPYIDLQIEPSTAEVGQQVIIVLRTNSEGDLEFELPDEFIQSGGVQSGMSSSINYINNKAQVEKYSYQKIAGHFEKSGKYKVGPAKLRSSSGELVSNSFVINVIKPINMISEDPGKNLNEPIFGIIQQSAREIYEGESVLLEAKVYAQVDIIQIDRFKNLEFKGPSETELLHTSSDVDRDYERIKGRDLLTFKAGKTVVFPERTGTFEISPFEMTIFCTDARSMYPARVNIKSNESSVKVKPLPDGAPTSFIGAVGDFSISSKGKAQVIEQGKVFELEVEISGIGNTHNIEVPQLNLPKGLVIYGDPTQETKVNFTSRGAEGSKTVTYYIQVNRGTNVEIPSIEIAYFDPKQEVYKTQSTIPFTLKVIPDENSISQLSVDKEESILEEVKNFQGPMIEKTSSRVEPIMTLRMFSVLTTVPLALAIVFGLIVKYRKENEEEMTQKQLTKNAYRNAKDSLSELKSNKKEDVFSGLSAVLTNFLSDKWNCSTSDITRELIDQKQELGAIDITSSNELKQLMDTFDAARFGILNVESTDNIIQRTESIIFEIDKIS